MNLPPVAKPAGTSGWRFLRWSGLVALLATALLWLVPTPYYFTAPGGAHAVTDVVQVAAAPNHPHTGEFMMLTVASDRANLLWYLYARLTPRVQLQARTEFLGPYSTYQEYQQAGERMMTGSRLTAVVAALRALGHEIRTRTAGVRVIALTAGSPSTDKLRPDDIIVAVADRPVSTTEDLTSALSGQTPGAEVAVRIRRGEGEETQAVTAGAHPDRAGAALGIRVETMVDFILPVQVIIAPGNIIGPSAGLAFALEIAEQLTPGGLLRGRRVAATGSVDLNGRVRPVGAVTQKVHAAADAGVDLVLVPAGNGEEAARAARRVQVVPVATVQDALQALRKP